MTPKTLLLLSDDLMFTSRISGTARTLGCTVRTARSAAVLETMAQEESTACVIIDLGNPGLAIADLAAKLQALTPSPRLIAYGSHVDSEALKAARDAGCDPVWPRSKFVQDLERALPGWISGAV